MLDFEVAFCRKCKNQYIIDENTSKEFVRLGLCDDCYFIKKYGKDVHSIDRKKLQIKNWQDKEIKKQWKKQSTETLKNLLSKCNGVNYKN